MPDDDKRYQCSLSIMIYDRQQGGGSGLRVEESFGFNAKDFLEVAHIMGKFHDLRTNMEKEITHGNSN